MPRKKTADILTIQRLQHDTLHMAMLVGNDEHGSSVHRHLLIAAQNLTLALLHRADPAAAEAALQTETLSHLRLLPSTGAAPIVAPPLPSLIKKVS